MSREPTICAVYRGDDLLAVGTVRQVAAQLGVKKSTVEFILTPTYRERRKTGIERGTAMEGVRLI